ncbi:MAG: hypothetical protein KIH67_002825 [Candidatus Moranbacteria bacterium]|nr:hypothetical protein [Candidatus Moranbacteria bacterium]
MSEETQTPESLRALGETIASLSPALQSAFLTGFIAGHDRLANETHRAARGKEDPRPRLHDKIARSFSDLRDSLLRQFPS